MTVVRVGKLLSVKSLMVSEKGKVCSLFGVLKHGEVVVGESEVGVF